MVDNELHKIRPQYHSPQTLVEFEFEVQIGYRMINGTRWKIIA
jgi:hypothetical protein